MKRIIYLLALLVLITTTSYAGKKVVLNTSTGEMKALEVPVSQFMNNLKIPAVESATIETPGTLPPASMNPVLPEFLLESQRVYVRFYRDTNDTAIFYPPKGKVPDSLRITHGSYSIPDPGIITTDKLVGMGQFTPGVPGDFLVDTIQMLAYVYDKTPANLVNQNFLLFSMSLLNANKGFLDITDTLAFKGINFDLEAQDVAWKQLADPQEIQASAINTTIDWNKSIIKGIYANFSPKLVIKPNQNFGFVLYPNDPPNLSGQLQWRGVYEWGSPQSWAYGCVVNHKSNQKDSITALGRYYAGYVYSMTKMFQGDPWKNLVQYKPFYMPLDNKPYMRNNFIMYAYGDFTESVEQTSDVPSPIALDQISPNPVANQTNITFSLDKSYNSTLRIYNASGQLVDEVFSKTLSAGSYNIPYLASLLPNGTYFVNLMAGSHSVTRTLQVLK